MWSTNPFEDAVLCQYILKKTTKQCDERLQKSHITSLLLKTPRVSICLAIVVATNHVDQMSTPFWRQGSSRRPRSSYQIQFRSPFYQYKCKYVCIQIFFCGKRERYSGYFLTHHSHMIGARYIRRDSKSGTHSVLVHGWNSPRARITRIHQNSKFL